MNGGLLWLHKARSPGSHNGKQSKTYVDAMVLLMGGATVTLPEQHHLLHHKVAATAAHAVTETSRGVFTRLHTYAQVTRWGRDHS